MEVSWSILKQFSIDRKKSIQWIDLNESYYLKVSDGYMNISCLVNMSTEDCADFETNFKSKGNKSIVDTIHMPFATKTMPDGNKLFRRKKGGTFILAASGPTTYEISNSYNSAKINEAELLWFPEGVTCNLKVLDTALGTYTTIPNYILNQFAFDVCIAKDFFKDTSEYDADIYIGMRILFEFTNNSGVEKTVGVNMTFHEVKA